jgi:hypothetical protein
MLQEAGGLRGNIALTKRLITQSFCLVPQAIGGKPKVVAPSQRLPSPCPPAMRLGSLAGIMTGIVAATVTVIVTTTTTN